MNNAPSLYSPVLEHHRLMMLIEAAEGEVTEEVAEALALNEQNVQARTGSLLDLLDVAQANIEMAKAKEAQVVAFRKRNEQFVARVKETLKQGVERFGAIKADTRTVSLRKSEETVITDDSILPDELRHPIVVPLQGSPDKAAIKARIKQGHAVPGAHIQVNQKVHIK